MTLWLALFRVAERALDARTLLPLPQRLAARMPAAATPPLDEGRLARALGRAHQLAGRSERLLPSTRCLHRALAARAWLLRRGISHASVVLGVRHTASGALTGHAWIEARASAEGPLHTAFLDGHPAYTVLLREHAS